MQPIIEAGPYTLRPPDRSDIPWVFAACQDAEIQRWTEVPQPYRATHAVGFVENQAGDVWPYVITRTESGELLGAIGLRSFEPGTGEGEIGYWLARDARGDRVIGTVLAALEESAASQLGARQLALRIADGNEPSLAIARRAGYALARREPGGCNGMDALVFTKQLGPAS
jgi:RimJ/RimL family protein N-acetyltransferase